MQDLFVITAGAVRIAIAVEAVDHERRSIQLAQSPLDALREAGVVLVKPPPLTAAELHYLTATIGADIEGEGATTVASLENSNPGGLERR